MTGMDNVRPVKDGDDGSELEAVVVRDHPEYSWSITVRRIAQWAIVFAFLAYLACITR